MRPSVLIVARVQPAQPVESLLRDAVGYAAVLRLFEQSPPRQMVQVLVAAAIPVPTDACDPRKLGHGENTELAKERQSFRLTLIPAVPACWSCHKRLLVLRAPVCFQLVSFL